MTASAALATARPEDLAAAGARAAIVVVCREPGAREILSREIIDPNGPGACHWSPLRLRVVASQRCTSGMLTAPSPTAEATRLTDPRRASPTAKTPGRLVSSDSGARSRGQQMSPSSSRSGPVRMNPHWSRAMLSPSHSVRGCEPMRMNRASAGTLRLAPEAVSARISDSRWRVRCRRPPGRGRRRHVRRRVDLADEVVGHAVRQRSAAHQDRHPVGPFGHAQRGLPGGVAASGHEHGPPVHGWCLADRGAVVDPLAVQALQAREPSHR